MRRRLIALMTVVALTGSLVAPLPAMACPMCKVAQEDATDPAVAARPKAYMYSILFMLSMPATLLAGFGIAFYRLSRQQQLLNDAAQFAEEMGPDSDELV